MPVLIVSPNGTITERPNLVTAFQHAMQPDPLLANTAKKTLIVTTSMSLSADVVVPQNSGIEIRITNDAVITVPSGRTLNLAYAEFQKPHYNCFVVDAGGTLILPEAGPVTQNWSVLNLLAAAGASIVGALTAATAAFTGTCTAVGGFIGDVTGNLTGVASAATLARNADGLGTLPTADTSQRIQRGTTIATDGNGVATATFPTTFGAAPAVTATPSVAVGGVGVSVHITAKSTGSVTFQARSGNSSIGGVTIDWIAIGNR